MDRTERSEQNDAQKIKIVFLSGAALIVTLLVVSFSYTYKARGERDALREQLETVRKDNADLEQYLADRTAENDALKKQVLQLQTQLKARPKPTPVKKAVSAKKVKKAKPKTRKSR